MDRRPRPGIGHRAAGVHQRARRPARGPGAGPGSARAGRCPAGCGRGPEPVRPARSYAGGAGCAAAAPAGCPVAAGQPGRGRGRRVGLDGPGRGLPPLGVRRWFLPVLSGRPSSRSAAVRRRLGGSSRNQAEAIAAKIGVRALPAGLLERQVHHRPEQLVDPRGRGRRVLRGDSGPTAGPSGPPPTAAVAVVGAVPPPVAAWRRPRTATRGQPLLPAVTTEDQAGWSIVTAAAGHDTVADHAGAAGRRHPRRAASGTARCATAGRARRPPRRPAGSRARRGRTGRRC